MSEPREARELEIETSRSGSALAYVPKLVLGALEDLRTIAQSVAVLPDVARALTSIQGRVDSLDDEVKRMRTAVESMGGDVVTMRDSVRPLESSLEELQRTVHPIRRATGRIDQMRGRGERVQLPEDPAAPTGT